MRRTAVPVSAFLLALAALTGCTSSGSGRTSGAGSAEAAGAFDPDQALAHRTREPYSATVHLTVEEGDGEDRIKDVVDGRLNFNTPVGGSETVHRVEGPGPVTSTRQQMTVEGVGYEKSDGDIAWSRTDTPTSTGAADQAAAYAKAMLDSGPAARRGMEKVAGIPVFHVAARLTVDQVRTADPGNADRMARDGVTELDCHLWFGRIVQGEQSLVTHGRTEVTKDLYTRFGPAETFTAPPVD
ncbi:hypothetical protein ACIBCA_19960 [Kitasatospora sp. NPDC051170]|uniref:hypothetical protein n=1 Tax=Kitasatospora sp. NPDC051170 TaxID=3364056 RepID=UPI00378EC94A